VKDRSPVGLRVWFERSTPAALAGIAERMLEAVRKGHWNTDARTIRELARTYTDLGERYGVVSANVKIQEYATAHRGFGLLPGTGSQPATAPREPAATPSTPPAATAAARAASVVRGQLLQPVATQVLARPLAWHYGAGILVLMLAGALWQARRQVNPTRVVAARWIRSTHMEE
jgi:cobaltochelatase CobN